MAENAGVFGTRKGLPLWPSSKSRQNGSQSVLRGVSLEEYKRAMERSRKSNKEFEKLRKRIVDIESRLHILEVRNG